MITDNIRESLYQELERDFPVHWTGQGKQNGKWGRDAARTRDNLNDLWRQEYLALEEQLVTQLLFRLQTFFEFPADDALVGKAVREALGKLYKMEESCTGNGSYDAPTYACFLFRKYWHSLPMEKDGASLSLLTGLQHVEQASFFHKVPQEVTLWARIFLLIERYHRLDASEHEVRLDRYRILSARSQKAFIRTLDDLLIWTEQALLQAPEGDISLLSRDLAHELADEIPQDLFPELPLQPFLYVVLKCHGYCLAETIDPPEQRRLDRILATREMDSLLDLMRLIIYRTMKRHRLPDVGSILDQLQNEGFHIEHSGFRDPYVVPLVSLADTEGVERARLPIFLPLDKLSGDFAHDTSLSRQMLTEWHRRIMNEITADCDAYVLALRQPMPRALMLRKLIRFAAGWVLAQNAWPISQPPKEMQENVRNLLPEGVIRHLVRPRKGYEIKSKQELGHLIHRESRRQVEALQRTALTHRIQGYYGYAQFARYAVFRHIQERQGPLPGDGLRNAVDAVLDIAQPEWITEVGRNLGIDPRHARPHVLESLREYILEAVPRESIANELKRHFECPEDDCVDIYNEVIDRVAPAFHRLTVAYGRHRARLPRLAASEEQIEQLVSSLAVPVQRLRQAARERSEQMLAQSGASFYRSELRSTILDAKEWNAFVAWEARRRIGGNVARFLDEGDLDVLLADVERAVLKVDMPRGTLFAETVRSTLLDLLKSRDAAPSFSDDDIRKVVALLPQLDCGVCGQASCRSFAAVLLTGRVEPRACVQLPPHAVQPLMEQMKGIQGTIGGRGFTDMNELDLLYDRGAWRSSPAREAFQRVLSPQVQKTRSLFLKRLKDIWNRLPQKPQIFKCPDTTALYNELCCYMGYEATERLREGEKKLLCEHGVFRQDAEWHCLKQRQEWLSLATRNRQSGPLLQRQDPAWTSQEAYRNIFFLHQLPEADRELVLRHRLEQHKDGFNQWWNEDLLIMNHPDFSVRDWEDFSKIIKNAYWHQEASLAAGDVLAVVQNELLPEENAERLLSTVMKLWIEWEMARVDQARQNLRHIHDGAPIESMARMREVIEALADEDQAERLHPSTRASQDPSLPSTDASLPYSVEARQAKDDARLWERFQNKNIAISASFSCRWDDLLPEEIETLKPIAASSSMDGTRPDASVYFLSAWDEPLQKRMALVQCLIRSCVRKRYEEHAECRWLEETFKEKPHHRPPLGSLRLYIRQRLREGETAEGIREKLESELKAHPDFRRGFLEDAILAVILGQSYEFLRQSGSPIPPSTIASSESDRFLEAFPRWRSFLNQIQMRHKAMDRERLLHYLFLLAKMEGNLDALTALLREIRETSDIIEAAWLRFTEERILEGPAPTSLPGTTPGIPLLVSRIEDKGVVNRCLHEGVARGEKRKVATAVGELLQFIRFHVLVQAERQGQEPDVLRELQSAGYDLSGIEEAALEAAVQREWARRKQLEEQKVWIFTTVTARRLAAQHLELQEVEREFYKIRLELLRDEKDAGYEEIASRRSIVLGQIKGEMYYQLSDLLESERIRTFHEQIRRIVNQLDQKREEIHAGWFRGEINRRTVFYLLRQYQKGSFEPTWEDFERFLRDHWFAPLNALRTSLRPDREERVRDLDERFRSLLGVSLLALEAETTSDAKRDIEWWIEDRRKALYSAEC